MDSASAMMTSAGRATEAAGRPNTLPMPIEAVGHHGENAYDMIKAGDWNRALASVDSLRSAIVGLAPAPGESSASTVGVANGVRALNQAIATRDRSTALREANHLTELGARLADRYDAQVPADVTLLDFYGRELEIWSAARDATKLRETASAMRRTWAELRPRVEARGGTAEIAQFDALIARVEAASTPATYAVVATPILDAVDALEAVFKR